MVKPSVREKTLHIHVAPRCGGVRERNNRAVFTRLGFTILPSTVQQGTNEASLCN